MPLIIYINPVHHFKKPMKYIKLLAFILIFTSCQSQETKLLLRQELISDLSDTPIYPRLTDEVNGEVKWKENFKYLDSIEIYGITYLSDGLKVNGLLVQPKKKGKYPAIIYNRGGNRNFGALLIAH